MDGQPVQVSFVTKHNKSGVSDNLAFEGTDENFDLDIGDVGVTLGIRVPPEPGKRLAFERENRDPIVFCVRTNEESVRERLSHDRGGGAFVFENALNQREAVSSEESRVTGAKTVVQDRQHKPFSNE